MLTPPSRILFQSFFLGFSWISAGPFSPWTKSFSPNFAPSGGDKISTISPRQAQSNIPEDKTPRSFAAFKFASTKTLIPTKSSREMWLTNPLTIDLEVPSPRSTISLYKLIFTHSEQKNKKTNRKIDFCKSQFKETKQRIQPISIRMLLSGHNLSNKDTQFREVGTKWIFQLTLFKCKLQENKQHNKQPVLLLFAVDCPLK